MRIRGTAGISIAAAGLILAACARPGIEAVRENLRAGPGAGAYITDVPFYPQEPDYCGPATLASILNYWGRSLSQEEIAAAVYLPRLRGTLTLDMMLYPERVGYQARAYPGGIEDLKGQIRKGRPLILLQDLGIGPYRHGHYIVVVGYDDRLGAVVAYSDRQRDLVLPYAELERTWRRAGYWTLLVLPREIGP